MVRYPVAASIACAGAFASLLLVAYQWAGAAHLDASALKQFIALRSPLSAALSNVALASVSLGVAACGVALLCALRFGWGSRPRVLAALGVLVSANLTSQVLKVALSHPRFDPVLGADQIGAAAFPSGHATAAMSVAVAAILVSRPSHRAATAAFAISYVVAVSLSLFVLAWHFPSDVLGGMLLATGFGFAGLAILRAVAPGSAPTALSPARVGALGKRSAGVLVLALGSAFALGLVLARADQLITYASTHTAATATGMLVALLGTSLLAGLTLLTRE